MRKIDADGSTPPATMPEMQGSARVPRAGCGVSPQRTLIDYPQGGIGLQKEVCDGGTPSPARETRALPISP